MKTTLFAIMLLITFIHAPVHAEFYKYTDPDGNVRYTDDLSKVPESQRSGVTSYDESVSTASDSVAPEKDKTESTAPSDEASEKSESDSESDPDSSDAAQKPDTDLDAQRKEIQQKQDALKKEYNALMEQKARLEAESKESKTVDESAEFDGRVKEFNKKIKAYDQRRKAINTEVKAMNAKMPGNKKGEKK